MKRQRFFALVAVLVAGLLLIVWNSPRRSYVRSKLTTKEEQSVNIVRLVRPKLGVGDCATSDPELVKAMVRATQFGVYKEVTIFRRRFAVDAGELYLYSHTSRGLVLVWGCHFDWRDFQSGDYNPVFVEAVGKIAKVGEPLGDATYHFEQRSSPKTQGPRG